MHFRIGVVSTHSGRELNVVCTDYGAVLPHICWLVRVTVAGYVRDVGGDAAEPVWCLKTELSAQPLKMEALPDYRRLHDGRAPPIFFLATESDRERVVLFCRSKYQ